MAKIQCKMCGGELTLPEGVTCGNCEYCGSLVTFPKITSDQLENLYNRAEHFRRINDYDKAVSAYEKVINANPDDPEAYWGLVLSKYGIEYVEDPASHERIPTCHRVQFESILADADYLAVLENAGSAEKEIYEAEAARIAEIQKGILAISSQEEPFDVFLCYKESDAQGKRTRDSVIAQDIYYALQEEGLKVFFARITLEGKLGQQYEPYIFAALNSAKAMLVIGSKEEYFNAVWVRNEWSRYLALMKRDRKKLLIPCYRDMDAYDIPEELSMFQAQDMSKIGFIQDILHGVKKVAQKSEAPKSAVEPTYSGNGKKLLRRAQLFVENEEFDSALKYCDRLLDDDPENGWAYFYRGMAELNISDEKFLTNVDWNNHKTFRMARRFADAELNAKIDQLIADYIAAERKRREEEAAAAERKRREEAEAAERKRREALLSLSSDGKTLLECNDKKIIDFSIPDSVVIIGESAFYGCSKLQSLTIPDSVTQIGWSAFSGCSNLRSVTIGNSVIEIDDGAFFNCSSLQNVTIPDSVTTIGNCAFYNCSSLHSVTIGNCVTTIGNCAFYNCSSLQSVTIPDSVIEIEAEAFSGCSSLQSVTIPDSVIEINAEAFSGCSSLQSVTIPYRVTKIGEEAFKGTALKEVRVPRNCKYSKFFLWRSFPADCKVIKY